MSVSSWFQILGAPGYLAEMYDAIPSPNLCELFYVHIDERDKSVTLGFDTSEFPSHPRPEWQEKGFNAFEFYLVFSSVQGLRVSGWGPSQAKVIDLTSLGDGRVRVIAGHAGAGIELIAPSVALTKTRAYLAASAS